MNGKKLVDRNTRMQMSATTANCEIYDTYVIRPTNTVITDILSELKCI